MKLVLESISLGALLLLLGSRFTLAVAQSPQSLTTESPTKGRPQRQCWKAFRDLSIGVAGKRQDRWVTSQAGLAIRTWAVTLAPDTTIGRTTGAFCALSVSDVSSLSRWYQDKQVRIERSG